MLVVAKRKSRAFCGDTGFWMLDKAEADSGFAEAAAWASGYGNVQTSRKFRTPDPKVNRCAQIPLSVTFSLQGILGCVNLYATDILIPERKIRTTSVFRSRFFVFSLSVLHRIIEIKAFNGIFVTSQKSRHRRFPRKGIYLPVTILTGARSMKRASFCNPLSQIIYKPCLCACSDKAMRGIVNMVPFKFHIPFRGNPLCPNPA
ncbi:MAG: hypothetical protein JRJ09_13890 [Deltaproteobacteria bacterium]|nr:hypothetical protein [Deltaproteobacteria bacterium]